MGIFASNIYARPIDEANIGESGSGYYDMDWGAVGQTYLVTFHSDRGKFVSEYLVIADSEMDATGIAVSVSERDGHQIDLDNYEADVTLVPAATAQKFV